MPTTMVDDAEMEYVGAVELGITGFATKGVRPPAHQRISPIIADFAKDGQGV